MEQLVHGTGYRLRWHNDMESFFKCHAAAILPLGYLAYPPEKYGAEGLDWMELAERMLAFLDDEKKALE